MVFKHQSPRSWQDVQTAAKRGLTRLQGGSRAADAKAAPSRVAKNNGAILREPKRVSSRKATVAQGIRLPARCMKLMCRNAAIIRVSSLDLSSINQRCFFMKHRDTVLQRYIKLDATMPSDSGLAHANSTAMLRQFLLSNNLCTIAHASWSRQAK